MYRGPSGRCEVSDHELIAERTHDAAALSAAATQPGEPDSAQERVQVLNTFYAFTPLQLDGPCVLRVRAQVGGEELKAMGLRVELLPPAPDDAVLRW